MATLGGLCILKIFCVRVYQVKNRIKFLCYDQDILVSFNHSSDSRTFPPSRLSPIFGREYLSLNLVSKLAPPSCKPCNCPLPFLTSSTRRRCGSSYTIIGTEDIKVLIVVRMSIMCLCLSASRRRPLSWRRRELTGPVSHLLVDYLISKCLGGGGCWSVRGR